MASESDGYRTPQSRVGSEDNLSVEQQAASNRASVSESLNTLITGKNTEMPRLFGRQWPFSDGAAL